MRIRDLHAASAAAPRLSTAGRFPFRVFCRTGKAGSGRWCWPGRRCSSIRSTAARNSPWAGVAQWTVSLTERKLAFDLSHKNNENDPWAMVSSAVGLAFCDRKDLSDRLSARALALDFSPSPAHWSYQAVIFFLNGAFEDCIAACDGGGDAFTETPAWRAAALYQLGRRDDAVAAVDAFVEHVTEKWEGETPPDRTAVAHWLLGCYPFPQPRHRRRLPQQPGRSRTGGGLMPPPPWLQAYLHLVTEYSPIRSMRKSSASLPSSFFRSTIGTYNLSYSSGRSS